jgi:ankyrin repeat protein
MFFRYRRTALHWAAGNGHLRVIPVLLSAGAEVDSKDKSAPTTEKTALKFKYYSLMFFSNGYTALNWAAQNGRLGIILVLLSAGAEVDSKDKSAPTTEKTALKFKYHSLMFFRYGYTALHYAAKNGHLGVIPVLLSAGAEVDSKNESAPTTEKTALKFKYHSLMFFSYGWTALHEAAWNGHLGGIPVLLSAGAEVDSKDKSAPTTEKTALKFKYHSLMFFRNGWTALHYAAKNGHHEVISVLLSAGAEVDSKDKSAPTTEKNSSKIQVSFANVFQKWRHCIARGCFLWTSRFVSSSC